MLLDAVAPRIPFEGPLAIDTIARIQQWTPAEYSARAFDFHADPNRPRRALVQAPGLLAEEIRLSSAT